MFYKEYDVEVHLSWRARIINDELYLCTTYTMRQMQGNTQNLRQFLDRYLERLCYHRQTSRSDSLDRRYIQATRSLCEGRCFSACTAGIESCTTCQTDFEVDITLCGRKKSWIVKIEAY